MFTVEPNGTDELIKQSISLAKAAIKSSCFEGLIGQIKESIKNKVNNLTEKLKININIEVKAKLSEMDIIKESNQVVVVV